MSLLRIISLCPSTTETLIDLGLEKNIVGRTIFCIHPKERVKNIKKVGGTKNPNFDKIKALNPTHIMFNLEENDISHLDEVKKIAKTIVTTPVDIESTIDMLNLFGIEFSRKVESNRIVSEINDFLKNKKHFKPFKYLYFIWNEPMMVVGKETYIDFMLSLFGGVNAIREISEERYVVLEDTKELSVDKVFLSSEPFPFKKKHELKYKRFSENVCFLDGEMVSWHGSRTPKGLNYLNYLLG